MPWTSSLRLLVLSGHVNGSVDNGGVALSPSFGPAPQTGVVPAGVVRPLLLRLGLWHITQTCTLLTRLPPCSSRTLWQLRHLPESTTARRWVSPLTGFITAGVWRPTLSKLLTTPSPLTSYFGNWVKYDWRATARIFAPAGNGAEVSFAV